MKDESMNQEPEEMGWAEVLTSLCFSVAGIACFLGFYEFISAALAMSFIGAGCLLGIILIALQESECLPGDAREIFIRRGGVVERILRSKIGDFIDRYFEVSKIGLDVFGVMLVGSVVISVGCVLISPLMVIAFPFYVMGSVALVTELHKEESDDV